MIHALLSATSQGSLNGINSLYCFILSHIVMLALVHEKSERMSDVFPLRKGEEKVVFFLRENCILFMILFLRIPQMSCPKGGKKTAEEVVETLHALLKEKAISEEECAPLVRALIETYPDLVNGVVCENNLSGMYAYELNFYRVQAFLADGTPSKETFKVVKLGMSTESLTNRIVVQARDYVNKNAWVQPRIPGFDPKDRKHTLSMMKKTYVTSERFAEFVRKSIETFPDMVFVAPGLVADETSLRERYGVRIGRWKLEKKCLKHFFDGAFDPYSVVTKEDGVIKAKGGWKIWLTQREDSPGVTNHSPGPSEYFLMRVQDIHDCRERFLQGKKLNETRQDVKSYYTSSYEIPHKCIIHRSETDGKPLVLLRPK
jgi:hypothetical protein